MDPQLDDCLVDELLLMFIKRGHKGCCQSNQTRERNTAQYCRVDVSPIAQTRARRRFAPPHTPAEPLTYTYLPLVELNESVVKAFSDQQHIKEVTGSVVLIRLTVPRVKRQERGVNPEDNLCRAGKHFQGYFYC